MTLGGGLRAADDGINRGSTNHCGGSLPSIEAGFGRISGALRRELPLLAVHGDEVPFS